MELEFTIDWDRVGSGRIRDINLERGTFSSKVENQQILHILEPSIKCFT